MSGSLAQDVPEKLSVRAEMLIGAQDPLIDHASIEVDWRGVFAINSLQTFDQVGHFIQFESPAALIRMREFINKEH